jgi:hypothetical protein
VPIVPAGPLEPPWVRFADLLPEQPVVVPTCPLGGHRRRAAGRRRPRRRVRGRRHGGPCRAAQPRRRGPAARRPARPRDPGRRRGQRRRGRSVSRSSASSRRVETVRGWWGRLAARGGPWPCRPSPSCGRSAAQPSPSTPSLMLPDMFGSIKRHPSAETTHRPTSCSTDPARCAPHPSALRRRSSSAPPRRALRPRSHRESRCNRRGWERSRRTRWRHTSS